MISDRDMQIALDNRQPPDGPWREVAAPPLRMVCAWCCKVLREGWEPTSHGICRECAEKLMEERK